MPSSLARAAARTAALLCTVSWAAAPDWPQFLGPTRNGTAPAFALRTPWPASGPPVVWKKEVGAGFSGPVVAGNRLVLFHRARDREVVDCLDAGSGRPVWSFEYPTGYRDDFGFDEGPRATPAVAGGKVFTYGAEGMLHGINFASGKKVWSVDTRQQFGWAKGFFGAACSPLVEGDRVLVNVGGPKGAGVVAFQADTGKVLWSATDDEASYSSPTVATIAGQRTALFMTRAGLVGLDPATGAVRLRLPWRSRSHASVNAATPLVVGDVVFISSSYSTGATAVEVSAGGKLRQLWSSDDALSNHYATSVHHGGYLYGFHGRQEYGASLRCVDLRTGKVQWSDDAFGAGTILLAGDRLVALRENGELVVGPASPKPFQAQARAKILGGTVRAYPALAGGLFYARSEKELVCVKLD